ncbi:DUF6092 family protein [Streptomyces sp. CRN 30]|uniref:DUF6092 family protein n=1 Tax=Streptomyces sp. CRN 30 TaxID=3075613 RepID=UPI002A7FF6D9|nr:DUF6092 family protein [Streptomyces sp. CRN 30]
MKSSDSTLPAPLREELLLLAGNLLCSARGLLQEPQNYGPMRCLGAAARVLDLLDEAQAGEPRLDAVRARIEEVLTGPQNHEHSPDLLDSLCEQVATVVKEPRD